MPSRGQRAALLVLLGAIFIYGSIRRFRNPVFVSDPQPIEGSRASELADRIDPNTADAETLAALPQMGTRRAAAIVSFREEWATLDKIHPAFEKPNDLLRVRGVGGAMLTQISPYLIFPTTMPATQP